MRGMIFKAVLVLVLGLMVFSLVQSLLISPLPVMSSINAKWGESYTNSENVSICVCDSTKVCYPCLTLTEPNQ